MRKTITYSTFIVITIVVIAMFLTAQTYAQLVLAAVLYPILAYLGFRIFPSKKNQSLVVSVQLTTPPKAEAEMVEATNNTFDIADIDKRAFLKLIGVAGFSFFLFSLFSKKAQVPFFGKLAAPGVTSVHDSAGNRIDPAERQPMDGYQISEIDDNVIAYYGFTHRNGSWLIMRQDSETMSFRYARGDAEFPGNWSNRERLTYDYFSNVF